LGIFNDPIDLYIVRKIGAGNAFNLAILVTGVLTVLSPLLIQSGIYIYIFGRFIEGVFEVSDYNIYYIIFSFQPRPNLELASRQHIFY